MGNGQAQACALPDGAVGRALREMTGPNRIAITDRFWFELLKVQLPGLDLPGYFGLHYEQPEALDALVRDEYFLQLVATNEHSGNFRTFLRFWARLLHYYRTSPQDAKPCSGTTILSLSLLCRCLIKHFAQTFSAPELIFQLEQAPYESAALADMDQRTAPNGGLVVTYCGKHVAVKLPPAADRPNVGGRDAAARACLEPFCTIFPEDADLLRQVDRCALRAAAAGETFAAADVAERAAADLGVQEFIICPCRVPHARASVFRSIFREVSDFLVSSSFGAVSGASPSPLIDGDFDAGEGQPTNRNISTTPQTMQLQVVLLEILLSLAAVVAPRYGNAPLVSDASVPMKPADHVDFVAPFLFLQRERRAAARAAEMREAASKVAATRVEVDALSECAAAGEAWPPPLVRDEDGAGGEGVGGLAGTNVPDDDGNDIPRVAAGEDDVQRRGLRLTRAGFQVPRSDLEEEEVEAEAQSPSCVALPLGPRELPSLPFLEGLLQVLDEQEEETEEGSVAYDGDTGGAGGWGRRALRDAEEATGARKRASQRGLRAEALLASLLNAVWLEAHAASLSRPPREVLRLLSGVPLPNSTPDTADSVTMPPTLAKEATGAASRLATRALVMLLLLLFHDSQAHPVIGCAFASLSDPLLENDGNRGLHTAASAPLNFTQLLRTVLGRLSDGLYPLLLYCLVHKNSRFRSYCLCRADADEVLVPMMEVLCKLPTTVKSMMLAAPPASAMALLLTLLALTGDRSFCEAASRMRIVDAGAILGKSRALHGAPASSALVTVILRLAHWNFATCRDAFFNKALTGILGNLSRHGAEQLNWYAADRILDMAQLLARNALKAAAVPGGPTATVPLGANDSAAAIGAMAALAERQRAEMVRQLLRALVRLISGCLRVPLVARNCSLVYALQRVYPASFTELEADPDVGPSLRHVRAVIDWFQVQCPPSDDKESDRQVTRIEAAAPRLPGAVDALSSSSGGGTSVFAYAESSGTSAYFLPVVWRAACLLLPDHVCWSKPTCSKGHHGTGVAA